MSAPIHKIDERQCCRHHETGKQQRDGNNSINRCIDRLREFRHALLSEQTSEEWQRGLAGRLSENSDGDLEKFLGIVQACNVAHRSGSKIAENPIVRGDQRDAKHKRNGQAHPFAKSSLPDVERNPVTHAHPRGADSIDQENSDECSGNGTISERGNSNSAGKQKPANYDPRVIEERTQRGQQKHPAREQNGRNNSAHVKKQLRRQENASEVHTQIKLCGRELAEHQTVKLRCEDLGQNDSHP